MCTTDLSCGLQLFFNFTPNFFKVSRKTCFRERNIILNFISGNYHMRKSLFFLAKQQNQPCKEFANKFFSPTQTIASVYSTVVNKHESSSRHSIFPFFFSLIIALWICPEFCPSALLSSKLHQRLNYWCGWLWTPELSSSRSN